MPSSQIPTLDDSGLVSEGGASAPSSPRVAQRGESLGRYVVLQPIGSGGMGVVYAAYDPELDRRVALKVLGAAASEESGPARLLREAQTMARISHPNVITVHDVGEVDGRLFIAMELVEGVDLKQWLADGGHPWQEVLDVLVQAGRGLAAAHDQGLIHRDFKPANVLVGDDGLVRVLDFGLARRFGGGGGEDLQVSETGDVEVSTSLTSHTEQLTRTGAVAGTPAYMSPEQHARGELDAKSDQFSFCITAFEALFGERPFKGTGRMSLMLAATQGDRQPVPKSSPVPSRITDAVLRGLEPKREDRWPDIPTLLEQLEHKPASRRNAAAAVLALIGVGGIVAASMGREPEDPCAMVGSPALLSDTSRTDVRTAFSEAGVPYADAALEHALQTLEAYATQWTRTRVEVCEATQVRNDRSESLHDLAVACLDRNRRDFEATLGVLAEADTQTVEQSAALLEVLPALAPCNDVESLLAAHPAPQRDAAAAVEAAEAKVARGRALLGARRDADALIVLREAGQAADDAAYGPTMAAAAFELAVALSRNAIRDDAQATFHRAAQLSTRIGDDRLLAKTWIEMARHIAHHESAHQESFRWFEYAEAVLDRVPNSFRLESDLRQARGSALSELGKLDEALAELEQLDARRPAGQRRGHPEELLLANIYTWKADFDAAAAALDRAAEAMRTSIGEDHPTFEMVHNGRGVIAFSTGDLAAAEQAFRKAYETLSAVVSEDSQDLLFSLGNMGEIQRMRGDYENAFASMLQVEAIVAKSFPPVHREAGTTQNNIASCLQEWGKAEDALPRFDVALEIRRQVHGDRHPYVANSLTGKGLALLDLGRAQDALPLFEEAFDIRADSDAPPRKRAATEFGLARALAATGGDEARARGLAQTARSHLASQADDPSISDRLAAIDAWLQQRDADDGDDAPKHPAPP